jgi:hypothetical protein
MKIEVGKRYWRRDGGLSGVIRKSEESAYPFNDGVLYFSETGGYWRNGKDHPYDLIREYVEPSQEVPGLEGYRIVRYGKAKEGDLVAGSDGVVDPWTGPCESAYCYFIVEKFAPEKRTIVFKEVLTRYGEMWVLDWRSDGEASEDLLPPDETIYTGNTREVTV